MKLRTRTVLRTVALLYKLTIHSYHFYPLNTSIIASWFDVKKGLQDMYNTIRLAVILKAILYPY